MYIKSERMHKQVTHYKKIEDVLSLPPSSSFLSFQVGLTSREAWPCHLHEKKVSKSLIAYP